MAVTLIKMSFIRKTSAYFFGTFANLSNGSFISQITFITYYKYKLKNNNNND